MPYMSYLGKENTHYMHFPPPLPFHVFYQFPFTRGSGITKQRLLLIWKNNFIFPFPLNMAAPRYAYNQSLRNWGNVWLQATECLIWTQNFTFITILFFIFPAPNNQSAAELLVFLLEMNWSSLSLKQYFDGGSMLDREKGLLSPEEAGTSELCTSPTTQRNSLQRSVASWIQFRLQGTFPGDKH